MHSLTLKGFIKTKYFIRRQKERKASDDEIYKVLEYGTLEFHSEGPCFVLDGFKVAVNLDRKELITVHPGERTNITNKIQNISKFKIVAPEIVPETQAPQPEEFEDITEAYLSGNYFKKAG